jgi:hypothetical protein
MKNNESIFGYFVFVYKVILILAIFKLLDWSDVVPDKLIATIFTVVVIEEIIALVYDGLKRGILFLIDEYEAHKRWRKFIEPIDDSKVRLYWNPETKELIQIENKK